MDYVVRWTEFDKNDRIQTKEKSFETEKELERFVAKLRRQNNFNQIVSWSGPVGDK